MSQLIYLSVNEANLDALAAEVGADYELNVVPSPGEVEAFLSSPQFDSSLPAALLIDAEAFDRFGVSLCWQAQVFARGRALSAILLLPQLDETTRLRAVELGCDDMLSRPFPRAVLDSKLKTHFKLQSLIRQVDEQSHAMDHVANELALVQDAAILCLAAIARVRDHSTGNHILRTQHYVKALAEHLSHHPRFSAELDSITIDLLYKSAALHDIGKVVIPDHILQKPSRLTDEEFEVMKQHTVFGYRAMHTAEQLLERSAGVQAAKFLRIGQQVTLSHHERWDGSGYPQGLKREQIPVVARLMAVADVYDAISSRRPYKAAFGHDEAVRLIAAGRGTHFDPDVVDAFLDLKDTFEHVAAVLEDRFPSLSDLTLHSIDDLLPEPIRVQDSV